MKPARSREWITRRPSASRANVAARSVTSGAVSSVGTSSISLSTGTGLKKCMPITAWGRPLAIASFMIGIDDVLDARIACASRSARPSSAKTRSFASRLSTTASIASWRSASFA
jgi:hypothetical protein